MTRVGLIGVGKTRISRYAIPGAHPRVTVAAVCDNTTYMTSALRKHLGVETLKDYRKMIDGAGVDAVFVATASPKLATCPWSATAGPGTRVRARATWASVHRTRASGTRRRRGNVHE